MKRSGRLCAVFLCILLFLPFFRVTTRAAAPQVLRVGWFQQDCYQEMTPAGKPYGFNYEYLMYIAQYTGWQYEFVPTESFSACYAMLKDGEIDMMGYLLQSDERAREVAFPAKNCGYAATSLYVRTNSPLAAYDFEAFNGLRVGCMPSKNPGNFLAYAAKNQFTPELVYYKNSAEIQQAVLSGAVDAGITAGYQPGEKTRIVASFAAEPFYFAVEKSNADALDGLNDALDRLQIENPLLERELAYKYLPEVSNTLHFTQAEKRYLEDCGTLTVAYQASWFPIASTDPKTGQFCGIVADVFKRLSDLTGLRFHFVEQTALDSAAIQASTLHSFTAEERGWRLSSEYLNVPLVCIQQKDGAARSTERTAMMHQLYKNFDLHDREGEKTICYDTFDDCLKAVLDGTADRAIVNAYASERMFQANRYRTLEANVLYNRAYDLCIAVRESENPALLSILNKGLSVISAADMSAIINQNLAASFDVNLSTILAYMPPDVMLVLVLLLVSMIVLAGFILWRQTRYAGNIKNLLCTDPLTGILSMKGFELELKNRLHHSGTQCAFLVDFDINHFGDYNAINGYQKGDEMLCRIARSLTQSGKAHELHARVQADHFICLLFEDTVEAVKARLLRDLQAFQTESESKCMLFSYGIYAIEDANEDISVLCDRALMAKRSVKGRYQRTVGVYDEALHRKQVHNTELLDSFSAALAAGEFIHYYQPKYDVQTQKPVGAEALVRWIRDGQVMMPGQFIELFERNGRIAELDLFLFERLCEKIAHCLENDIMPFPISINFSRVHLFDERFVAKLAHMVSSHCVPPRLIEIEITETAFSEGRSAMIETIDALHEVGFLVSIDDFGSGFSSLNTLKDANFDIIKLDRDFLGSAEQTQREENIIARVIELAQDLHLKTVAEGVETGVQYDMMKRCGCDTIQGYYFSPPVPECVFDRILRGEA